MIFGTVITINKVELINIIHTFVKLFCLFALNVLMKLDLIN